jgi:ankyrin repeat protein
MQEFLYDAETEILTVKYDKGEVYEFFDISPTLYAQMSLANSQIEFFNKNIWPNFEHASPWSDIEAFFEYFSENMFEFEKPVNIDSRRSDEDTPLHVICRWGDISALDLLIDAGADVNAKGDMGYTPLHVAVGSNHMRCAQRLLRAGAMTDVKNEFGFTARENALKSGEARMIALFEPASSNGPS